MRGVAVALTVLLLARDWTAEGLKFESLQGQDFSTVWDSGKEAVA
jgi:hypothetical protein